MSVLTLTAPPLIDEDMECDYDSMECCNDAMETTIDPTPAVVEQEPIPLKRQFRGLRNLGNTCYLNSALQALFATEGFLNELRSRDSHQGSKLRDGLLELYDELFKSAPDGDNSATLPVSPSQLKETLDERSTLFHGFLQQDSHEFLMTLLDLLDEECKAVKETPKETSEEASEETSDETFKETSEEASEEASEETSEETLEETESDENVATEENKPVATRMESSVAEIDFDEEEIRPSLSTPYSATSFSQLQVDGISELLFGGEPKLLGGRVANSITFADPMDVDEPINQVQNGILSSADPSVTTIPEEPTVVEEAGEEHQSPIQKHFSTEVRCCLTCDSCKYSRTHNENYLHFSLDIADGSIEDGLRQFFAPQKRSIKCEKCFGESATLRMTITRLPKVLLLHLKRFIVEVSDDYTSISYRKNDSSVDIPEVMVHNPLVEALSENSAYCDNVYKLKSIVHHLGSSMDYGHYVADVQRDQQWRRFNDSSVCEIKKEEVLGTCGKKSAYILMYELS